MATMKSGENGNPGIAPLEVSRTLAQAGVLPRRTWQEGDGDEALRVCASQLNVDLSTPEGKLEATRLAVEAGPSLVMSPERRERFLLQQSNTRAERELSESQRKRMLATQEQSIEAERVAGFEAQTCWQHALEQSGLMADINPTTTDIETLRRHSEAIRVYGDAVAPQLNKLFGTDGKK